MCSGDWEGLVREFDLNTKDLEAFLEYAATFLSNVRNYYVCF